MRFTRASHRFAAWLAMLAMALGALAPTLAQAVVSAQGHPGWMQVCSASGMVWVNADELNGEAGAGGDVGKSMADVSRHCPWAQLHGAAGLPPAQWQGPLPAPQAPVALVQVRSFTPASFWPAAPSRAPPRA